VKTVLLGGSGFLGPEILSKYPDIVSVGRTRPSVACEHLSCPTVGDLDNVLGGLEFDKVIMMIGSSNHHELNSGNLLAIEKNVLPLKIVFNTLRKYKIKKLISFTSILLYDREMMTLPVSEDQQISPYQNDYIFSKYLAEEVAKFYQDVPNIIARLTNIYGPTTALGRPDVVNQLVEGLILNKKVAVQNTEAVRDFIYTVDVAEAVVRLLDSEFVGTVNLASGKKHSILEIVELLESLSGISIERLNMAATGHRVFEADIKLLKHITDWEPRYDLEKGLTETYRKMEAMYG
jgi:UDP-glucose 4-epimerase